MRKERESCEREEEANQGLNKEIPPIGGIFLVIRIGFEPMTYCLEGSCSIQLSYRTFFRGGKIKEKTSPEQIEDRAL
jgi:hypothetical protein